MDKTMKTPLEDLRKQALEHYEEAATAIVHYNSFVRDAIMAYDPEQKLLQHGVMQAEGSEETRRKFCLWYYAQSQPLDANKVFEWFRAQGATVASEGYGEANKCVDAGCPQCKNTDIYDIDDHWTKCNNCGFTFVG